MNKELSAVNIVNASPTFERAPRGSRPRERPVVPLEAQEDGGGAAHVLVPVDAGAAVVQEAQQLVAGAPASHGEQADEGGRGLLLHLVQGLVLFVSLVRE